MRLPLKLLLLVGLVGLLTACPDKKKPKYPDCEGDADCQEGEKCFNKKCSQCAEDSDCPAGQQCDEGSCSRIAGWCDSADDCPDGKICQNNACAACASDAQCDGGKCVDGACRGPGYCTSDEACAEDEDCVDNACTPAAAATTTGGGTCDLEDVYFEFDEDKLGDSAKATLDSGAECLKSGSGNVDVIGHADERGTVEYNIALSDRRAQSVINYLKRLGISDDRLDKVPMGEAEATGSDEDGYTRDRRVELKWK